MLSEVGWLVLVWIAWIVVATVVITVCRLAMRDQQKTSADMEAHIIALRTGQNEAAVRAAMATASGEEPAAAQPAINWRLRMPRRPAPPPLGA